MSLFKKGFCYFAKSGALCDVILVHTTSYEEGQPTSNTYYVHRLILAYSSEFFRTLLSSNFKEKRQLTIHLNFPDPANVFPEILEYMYRGYVKITTSNVVALLTQADHYLIPTLVRKCTEFINQHLTRFTVVKVNNECIFSLFFTSIYRISERIYCKVPNNSKEKRAHSFSRLSIIYTTQHNL